MKKELMEAINIELSQMASPHSPLVDAPDPRVLGACVSTKEPSVVEVTTMGLYIVVEECTWLVALGKVFDNVATIHNVPYADDVLRVNVITI